MGDVSLGGEKVRWGQNVTDLAQRMELLPGDCIVAAGMISYAGPFNSEVRGTLESDWVKRLIELKIFSSSS